MAPFFEQEVLNVASSVGTVRPNHRQHPDGELERSGHDMDCPSEMDAVNDALEAQSCDGIGRDAARCLRMTFAT